MSAVTKLAFPRASRHVAKRTRHIDRDVMSEEGFDGLLVHVLSQVGAVAWVADDTERFVWVSRAYAKITGMPAEGLRGATFASVGTIHTLHSVGASGPQSIRRVLLQQAPVEVAHDVSQPRGTQHLTGYIRGWTGPQGKRWIVGWFASPDITEDHLERLRPRLGVYQEIFANSDAAMAVLDRSGTIVECNAEFTVVTGRDRADLAGQAFWVINPQAAARALQSTFSKIVTSLHRYQGPIIIECSDRPRTKARMRLTALSRRSGDRVAALLTISAVRAHVDTPAEDLREVEKDILCHVAAGATTAKIAKTMHMSRQGVDYNLRTLMQRFNATNRAELVARAYTTGALSPTAWPPVTTQH